MEGENLVHINHKDPVTGNRDHLPMPLFHSLSQCNLFSSCPPSESEPELEKKSKRKKKNPKLIFFKRYLSSFISW